MYLNVLETEKILQFWDKEIPEQEVNKNNTENHDIILRNITQSIIPVTSRRAPFTRTKDYF